MGTVPDYHLGRARLCREGVVTNCPVWQSPDKHRGGALPWLVLRARAKATGANVHGVTNACQAYLFARHMHLPEADDLERQLHAFVKSGAWHR